MTNGETRVCTMLVKGGNGEAAFRERCKMS